MSPPPFPPAVSVELEGWCLQWLRLVPTGGGAAELARLRAETVAAVRREVALETLAGRPVVAAVRRAFRAAGCDPTRYRPSSEALVRRVLKGGELPAIDPLVDLNNLLSLTLLVPCCVVDAEQVEPPFVLRAGRDDESMESLRGRFALRGKPLLADARGPFGTPITDSVRVRITPGVREAWLVAYAVPGALGGDAARTVTGGLLEAAPVARLAGAEAAVEQPGPGSASEA